jgi:small-conductance mechanosensitive channel
MIDKAEQEAKFSMLTVIFKRPTYLRTVLWVLLWIAISGGAYYVSHHYDIPNIPVMKGKEGDTQPPAMNYADLISLIAIIMILSYMCLLVTQLIMHYRGQPPVEGQMIGRIYLLVAILAIILTVSFGFGTLGALGSFMAMFGGMLLGWSLQAPISGFAAWGLVSLKRPFRPGDRVQFPSLGLTGDVKDIGFMYTVLDQVGGTISSEEAVGRYILVPNAMLFSQVVINYTVKQEAAYMLDEVVIRITYDSDWEVAERILIKAAEEVTGDIMKASGVQPYVRSDWYDYGVYLRLRYQTAVKDRVEIAYKIQKKIFTGIQDSKNVDMAIPFIYSYRAGMDRRSEGAPPKENANPYKIHEIPISEIEMESFKADDQDIRQLMDNISKMGLLQPIIVIKNPKSEKYEIMAGHLRLEACKRLGWKSVPAVVKGNTSPDGPWK